MKSLYINIEKLETRVALVENNILAEYEVERSDQARLVGSVFKGRIKNLEDSLQAAFVDIGFQKNAFLHYWDMIPAANNAGLFEDGDDDEIDGDTKTAMDADIGDGFVATVKASTSQQGQQDKIKAESARIPELFPVGSEVVVQVTKGPIGTKGPASPPTCRSPAATSSCFPTPATSACRRRSSRTRNAPASAASSRK